MSAPHLSLDFQQTPSPADRKWVLRHWCHVLHSEDDLTEDKKLHIRKTTEWAGCYRGMNPRPVWLIHVLMKQNITIFHSQREKDWWIKYRDKIFNSTRGNGFMSKGKGASHPANELHIFRPAGDSAHTAKSTLINWPWISVCMTLKHEVNSSGWSRSGQTSPSWLKHWARAEPPKRARPGLRGTHSNSPGDEGSTIDD